MTPNPFEKQNWVNLPLLTVESLFLGILFGLSVLTFLIKKSTRRFFFLVFLGVSVYACALTVVGQFTLEARSLDYGLFSAGDNILRKKIPMLPMFFIAISFLFSYKQTKPEHK